MSKLHDGQSLIRDISASSMSSNQLTAQNPGSTSALSDDVRKHGPKTTQEEVHGLVITASTQKAYCEIEDH